MEKLTLNFDGSAYEIEYSKDITGFNVVIVNGIIWTNLHNTFVRELTLRLAEVLQINLKIESLEDEQRRILDYLKVKKDSYYTEQLTEIDEAIENLNLKLK